MTYFDIEMGEDNYEATQEFFGAEDNFEDMMQDYNEFLINEELEAESEAIAEAEAELAELHYNYYKDCC